MAALAMEKNCGYRPRGERRYRLWAVSLFFYSGGRKRASTFALDGENAVN